MRHTASAPHASAADADGTCMVLAAVLYTIAVLLGLVIGNMLFDEIHGPGGRRRD
ncbi:MAG: hypothetical protein AAF467_27160 [Actinomycetota bacterium]